MNLRAAAKRSEEELAAAGVPDAAFEAEYLVRHATGASRARFYAGGGLPEGAEARLVAAVTRRVGREPSAYITRTREFYGRQFLVGPSVLVPRPETELLVELALAELNRAPGTRIVDVGTGSGCIAVSVAAEVPGTCVVAVDVSAEALAVARLNAERYAPTVSFARADLLSAVGRADVVLANLPYIPTGEIDALEPEVSKWEPRVALDGGADGLDLIRRLIGQCAHAVHPRLLGLEVGYGQASVVGSALEEAGARVEILPDLAGIERVVCGRWE